MSFWVILDDSLEFDELLAGAGAAAIGAFLAELVGHQAASQVRMRAEWVIPALKLPRQLARDTALIFMALGKELEADNPATSDAVRQAALVFAGPVMLMGWFLASHAQTSPSGGFQGGVVLATAFFVILD